MNNHDFFSEGRYINLPPFQKRVSLNANNYSVLNETVKLYNPFSKKAKWLKKICLKIVFSSKGLIKVISKNHKKGEFINFIENKLNEKFISSIYYPTIKDKLVLQLIGTNEKVFGYLKIGLNNNGNRKINIEKDAIAKMTSIGLVSPNYLIYEGNYLDKTFILFKEIEGNNNDLLTSKELAKVLDSLKKDNSFMLNQHPGIFQLAKKAKVLNQDYLYGVLKDIIKTSHEKYKVVFEHGDFAPWNMFKNTNGEVEIFDFEYFTDEGIEYLDEFNYHYQIGKLLLKMKPDELMVFLRNKVKIKEFDLMFKVFLINRILHQKQEHSKQSYERTLLKLIIETR